MQLTWARIFDVPSFEKIVTVEAHDADVLTVDYAGGLENRVKLTLRQLPRLRVT